MVVFNVLLSSALALQAVAAPVPVAAAAEPPPPDQVMAIPGGLMQAYRQQVLDRTNAPEQRMRRMVDFMFDKDGLALEYKADATHTVAESYRTRQVNCLSFTLMAVALARAAGLEAHGQEIDRVLAWNLTGDVVMQSMHANVVVTIDRRDYMVDIASSRLYAPVLDYQVDDQHLMASFYGNRAMELLAAGQLDESKKWLGRALELSPEDAAFWNNAGVLSQRMGDPAAAEELFLRAAKKNPRLMSALSNLVALYHARGDSSRTAYWQDRAESILRKDPYYQFSLAERHAQSGDYRQAVDLYRRAISLEGDEQLFHFGLARAYMQLGELDDAESEMDVAYRLSGGSDRSRFQAKLDALRGMTR